MVHRSPSLIVNLRHARRAVVAASIEYEFKAGKKYEIACRNGVSAVRQLNT